MHCSWIPSSSIDFHDDNHHANDTNVYRSCNDIRCFRTQTSRKSECLFKHQNNRKIFAICIVHFFFRSSNSRTRIFSSVSQFMLRSPFSSRTSSLLLILPIRNRKRKLSSQRTFDYLLNLVPRCSTNKNSTICIHTSNDTERQI